ncbi:MAG: DUF1015 domain-containing protein [Deltaproteobacteria bacterium HGW-Deltaproteobacteria-19]|jgi:uncharacterized protein (DUF1015 family)|nr:MAG: DUF1015 domain-containing protein [Deltaproteobacteria bacterium HGW-Deltaproteobacteria-19]
MVTVKPFTAVHPRWDCARQVAAPPYDVVSRDEAARLAAANPLSFLRVEKSEIDLPAEVPSDDDAVFARGRENLDRLLREGILVRDGAPHFYLYRQTMGGHSQTGLVAVLSTREYESGKIRRHEFTREDKERERTRHVDRLNAQTGPVFVTYRNREDVRDALRQVCSGSPMADFTADDGVGHTVWTVKDPAVEASIRQAFTAVDALYIADGHHRAAAAAAVARARREADPDSPNEDAPWNFFLAVLFSHDEIRIMDYNRAVKDLNGMDEETFLREVSRSFRVTPGVPEKKPGRTGDFGMYLRGRWYGLTYLAGSEDPRDPVASLDVSILQDRLLGPVLGIGDPRTDVRIDFIGGIRGPGELERLVDSGGCAVAFTLFPTSLDQMMAVADTGRVMPPKSTWFEPKLRSGLFVHFLD